MTEMKRKLKIMSHQINQLKDEIASKVAKMKAYRDDVVKSPLFTLGKCSCQEQHGAYSC